MRVRSLPPSLNPACSADPFSRPLHSTQLRQLPFRPNPDARYCNPGRNLSRKSDAFNFVAKFDATGQCKQALVKQSRWKPPGEQFLSPESYLHESIIGLHLPPSPHVVPVIEVAHSPAAHWLVMEVALGGDMFQHVMEDQANPPVLTPSQLCRWFRQLVLAIDHLHAFGYAHLDLSMDNLLFADLARTIVWLCDFGMAVRIPRDPQTGVEQPYRGSFDRVPRACLVPPTLAQFPAGATQKVCCASPERIQYTAAHKQGRPSPVPVWLSAVDVYACGAILLMCFVQEYLPLDSPPHMDAIQSGRVAEAVLEWKRMVLPAPVLSLCNACLHADPDRRPSVAELIERTATW